MIYEVNEHKFTNKDILDGIDELIGIRCPFCEQEWRVSKYRLLEGDDDFKSEVDNE